MTPQINFKENNKLRIRNADPSFFKHEQVKLTVMLLSRFKYPNAGIYSEQELTNGDIVDVLVDLGEEKIYYEVQKEISAKWLDSIKERDLQLNINTQVIKLKELPDDLIQLERKLKELII